MVTDHAGFLGHILSFLALTVTLVFSNKPCYACRSFEQVCQC